MLLSEIKIPEGADKHSQAFADIYAALDKLNDGAEVEIGAEGDVLMTAKMTPQCVSCIQKYKQCTKPDDDWANYKVKECRDYWEKHNMLSQAQAEKAKCEGTWGTKQFKNPAERAKKYIHGLSRECTTRCMTGYHSCRDFID